jgi:P27 family predicted phage terminase small subunit
MQTPSKEFDSLGRVRRITQGGAGPKHLPDKDNATKSGAFEDTPPPDLGEHGLFCWRFVVYHTAKMGILDMADWLAVGMFCRSYEGYMIADEDIKKNGREFIDENGNRKRNTAYVTKNERTREVVSFVSSFALHPSSRAKFGASDKEEDPFLKITAAQGAASRKRN